MSSCCIFYYCSKEVAANDRWPVFSLIKGQTFLFVGLFFIYYLINLLLYYNILLFINIYYFYLHELKIFRSAIGKFFFKKIKIINNRNFLKKIFFNFKFNFNFFKKFLIKKQLYFWNLNIIFNLLYFHQPIMYIFPHWIYDFFFWNPRSAGNVIQQIKNLA